MVPKPHPSGLRSPPHGIVKKLAISRVRKTQQEKEKGEPARAAALSGTAATTGAVDPKKKELDEAKPTPGGSVGEEKKEGGVTGKSYTSLPSTPGTLGGVGCRHGNWLPRYCSKMDATYCYSQ